MILITFLEGGGLVAALIGCALVGVVGGYFLARFIFKRELKKNPPINEKMIRAMFLSMGRKPSEAQIKQVLNNVNNQNK